MTNEGYGFCSDYSVESISRRMQASDYANARGAYRSSSDSYQDNCYWCLRSPGSKGVYAATVNTDGGVHRNGTNVINDDDGLCPALHINLSSAIWSETDEGTSGEGGEERILVSLKATKGKNVYYAGEALAVDDLKVIATYKNHSKKELQVGEYTTNAYQINMDTAGEKTLTVSYTSEGTTKTASITITAKSTDGSAKKATVKIKIK